MTENQKRDKYYKKKYGASLAWYNKRFKEQDSCCGICKRPQKIFKKRLAVDHDHAYKHVIISCVSAGVAGIAALARAHYLGKGLETLGRTKLEARLKMKKLLKTQSCRGLLCPHCNRGLRYYADNPARLENAAAYLRRHQNETN